MGFALTAEIVTESDDRERKRAVASCGLLGTNRVMPGKHAGL